LNNLKAAIERPSFFGALLKSGVGVGFVRLEKFMNTMFAAFLGGWEWVVVLLALLLLFGAKKIPELARGLGHGIKEFKKATREVTDEIQNTTDENSTQQKKPSSNGQSQPVQSGSQSSNPPKA